MSPVDSRIEMGAVDDRKTCVHQFRRLGSDDWYVVHVRYIGLVVMYGVIESFRR